MKDTRTFLISTYRDGETRPVESTTRVGWENLIDGITFLGNSLEGCGVRWDGIEIRIQQINWFDGADKSGPFNRYVKGNEMLKTLIISTMLMMGCVSPTTPTNCLDPGLETTYERLEGVRPEDPDYALAETWSTMCSEWGLLSEKW